MSGPHGPEQVDFDLVRIRYAVSALRFFNADLKRHQAADILPHWPGYEAMTEQQREAVLRQFPASES